mmetsp:Transcript_37142/g.82627  ORF Transcript_37142/g.82627 Transcript_37142/m.82627 type:complete len:96 (-) Transcript_37142:293-580(-)
MNPSISTYSVAILSEHGKPAAAPSATSIVEDPVIRAAEEEAVPVAEGGCTRGSTPPTTDSGIMRSRMLDTGNQVAMKIAGTLPRVKASQYSEVIC